VRQETDELRARWRAEVEREQAVFLHDVQRYAAEHFETLARRALADLASADLESEMARVLVERLGALDDARRAALVRASASGAPVRVRSAFELPAPVKRTLTSAIRDTVGADVEVSYEQADDVVCGVEIRTGGESLAWSLEGYLDTLEQRLADGLGEHGRRGEGAR
jgi:F-type H+-transporting ATPase subunit b